MEYCKAYARAKRWEEEVPLLREEMRRTLVSLEATAARWDGIAQRDARDGPLGEGARAYAYTQADVYRRLAAHFEALWRDARKPEEATEAELQKLLSNVEAAEQVGIEQVPEADDEGDVEDDEEGWDAEEAV